MERQSGFSLIEAIVSLVILTGVVVSVYAWTDNALRHSQRTIESQELTTVVQNFLSEMSSRIIIREKKGLITYGEYSVRWNSELIDQSQGVMRNGAKSDFAVALVNLKFDVIKDSELIGAFFARQAVSRWQEPNTVDQLP